MAALTAEIRSALTELGADLVGFGDLTGLSPETRESLPVGISVAVVYPPKVIRGIVDLPTPEYAAEYERINLRLESIITRGAELLCEKGYKAVAQTRAHVGSGEVNDNTTLPHKTVATRAGLGWIGRCALLVTDKYGSALRIASILTDAPLEPNAPVNQSYCGKCSICAEACPGSAVSGKIWELNLTREDFFDHKKCRETAKEQAQKGFGGEITICGRCIAVCPYTKQWTVDNGQ
ncbi:MAG: epoxyqueuosine reductase [Oscillospiraceae bacterium]|nr:epoxyqueuosine reductase [Oscillospiraceae bacterium]